MTSRGKGTAVAGKQHKILLDSNAYFRLAKSVHPLLFQEFGPDRACLYVLPELEQEYQRQPRLKAKFPWVEEEEFQHMDHWRHRWPEPKR